MRIDYKYLNQILENFLEATSPNLSWKEFEEFHTSDADKFVFHMRILNDRQLVVPLRDVDTLGILEDYPGEYHVSVIPWRLSADGHDFAAALSKPEILSAILTKFKDEGIGAVVGVAKALAEKQIEKLISLDDE